MDLQWWSVGLGGVQRWPSQPTTSDDKAYAYALAHRGECCQPMSVPNGRWTQARKEVGNTILTKRQATDGHPSSTVIPTSKLYVVGILSCVD